MATEVIPVPERMVCEIRLIAHLRQCTVEVLMAEVWQQYVKNHPELADAAHPTER